VLEAIHAGMLLPGPRGTYILQRPLAFSSLAAMSGFALGSRRAQHAQWRRMSDEPDVEAPHDP
jgi:hypothetical protein